MSVIVFLISLTILAYTQMDFFRFPHCARSSHGVAKIYLFVITFPQLELKTVSIETLNFNDEFQKK